MIIQAIQINGQENHLLCSMQCHLNGVYISEVPKFLAMSPSVTTHVIKLIELSGSTTLCAILLHSSNANNYLEVYFPSIAEYENEDIPKADLTAKEPLLDP